MQMRTLILFGTYSLLLSTNYVPGTQPLTISIALFNTFLENLHISTRFTKKETEAPEANGKDKGRLFPRPHENEGMELKFKSLQTIMHQGQRCGH